MACGGLRGVEGVLRRKGEMGIDAWGLWGNEWVKKWGIGYIGNGGDGDGFGGGMRYMVLENGISILLN